MRLIISENIFKKEILQKVVKYHRENLIWKYNINLGTCGIVPMFYLFIYSWLTVLELQFFLN